MNLFQSLYLTHFSKPIEDRPVYREVAAMRPKKIAEIGIQRGIRTQHLLELAIRYCYSAEEIEYYCSDPFEGRTVEDGCGLSLRKAHRLLNLLDVRFRPFPSEPEQGIAQIAKTIPELDFLVIATPRHDWISNSLAQFETLLGSNTVVMLGTRVRPDMPYNFERLLKADLLKRFAQTNPVKSLESEEIERQGNTIRAA